MKDSHAALLGMALRRFTLLGFWALLGLLAVLALLQYPGRVAIYILFTVTANLLLYFGFRQNAIFFDTFIGLFFWLGFWLKLSVRVAFLDGRFHEPTGHFDGSGPAFDRALLVASCAFVGLLLASTIRERFFFTYPAAAPACGQEGLRAFYERHRKAVLIGAALLIAAVAVTNFLFGIYQRGMVPRTALRFGLGGVYSWLLLFGLASVSALILNFEIVLRKSTSTPAVALALMESFLTNASLLSRGMILNAGALGYGLFRALGFAAIWQRFRFWAAAFMAFVILFGCSIVLVNYLRMMALDAEQNKWLVVQEAGRPGVLMLDRWVGIEGVMAVSSYPRQGWALFSEAWQERPARKMSLYDAKMIASPYANMDTTMHHHISLPGIVGFLFYPGSFAFLFACMVMLGLLAAGIEISVVKLGGRNLVLCALLSQVVAARYAHFGYVPAQSYLLFGALYLNLFLIYFFDKALLYWRAKNPA
jgi:hypothetical protein